jgi:peroxiredoxin
MQTVSVLPPAPPASKEAKDVAVPAPKRKKKGCLVFGLFVALIIIGAASYAGYSWFQRRAQIQSQEKEQEAHVQETFAVAQTLTNLPLPTLIPTWTASPSSTFLPTNTFTAMPTFTPTLEFTLTKTPRPSSLVGPVVGLYAPDFSLTNEATGQPVTLGQFDGSPVLIFFWSTSCTGCTNEINVIKTISQTYQDAGLVILGINTGEAPAAVSVYRKAHLLTFPLLLDAESEVQGEYLVVAESLPRHFFINSSGRIVSIRSGEMTLAEMTAQVDAIMP